MAKDLAKLAVLIDADNAQASLVKEMFEEIAGYGIASVKRIYGDWSSPTLKGWSEVLLSYAITPVQQFAYTKSKDATDMQLIIDGMDLLYSGIFEGFCIISSDSDFTPLATRIRANGLKVYGIGREKTPEAFRKACDKFIYTEILQAEANKAKFKAESAQEKQENLPKIDMPANTASSALIPRQPVTGSLAQQLRIAMKESMNDEGWASVSRIGIYLSQTNSDFDTRRYGYANLSGMLKQLEGIQFRTEGTMMFCRKIPYLDLLKILNEGIEKFADKNGTASLEALNNYLKSRLPYAEYGFESLEEFIQTVHNLTIENGRVRTIEKTAG